MFVYVFVIFDTLDFNGSYNIILYSKNITLILEEYDTFFYSEPKWSVNMQFGAEFNKKLWYLVNQWDIYNSNI